MLAKKSTPSYPSLVLPTTGDLLSIDELIQSAVDLARSCLGMDVGFVTEFKDGLRIFRHVASAENFSLIKGGDYDPLDQSFCQYVVDGTIPSAVLDSHDYPQLVALSGTQKWAIRAHLGVPIRLSNGDVFGTFCCYSRSPKAHLSTADVDAMTHFAWLIGQLLDSRVMAERKREAMVVQLESVIDNAGLTVVYQPVIDVTIGALVGYEAFARFSASPQRGPDVWFNEAHTVGLGDSLEVLAIQKAIHGLPAIAEGQYLALNVSPQTILSGALDDTLRETPLRRVMLEVTELISPVDHDGLAEALGPLRVRGLRIAVDDAGSGYASFSHILRLKPDVVKLGQNLIRRLDSDPGSRALATALVRLARDTGGSVTAEGVETDAELATLLTLGVSTAQGFLLGRPGPLPC